jgi:hypothetical protein
MVVQVLNYSVRSCLICLPCKGESDERLCHIIIIIIIPKDVNRMLTTRNIMDHLSVITVDNDRNKRDRSLRFLFFSSLVIIMQISIARTNVLYSNTFMGAVG